jgi:hypothetical protein
MWKQSSYCGSTVAFAPVVTADELLHPVPEDAPFSSIETNLYGFNIPAQDIQCNIYVLWHRALHTMSMHVFVYRGARILPHQLAADYINEHLFLPEVLDISDWRMRMGSCAIHFKIIEPLHAISIEFDDPQRRFALQLNLRAALPPVGRPGGKHFTQLMKTGGEVVLDGTRYAIDGYYMRDRSWGYSRPEEPERTPPYRWMTGWFGEDTGFVVAWLDIGMLDAPEFGPQWAAGKTNAGSNKWESGGPTPSAELRSGWIAVRGKPEPIVRMDARTLPAGDSHLRVARIELLLEDASGRSHQIQAETVSMIPKLYWGNLLTYMHFMRLDCGGRAGHGDLMDTYSNLHIRRFGL